MKPCNRCNAAIENDAAAFCPTCGAPQQAVPGSLPQQPYVGGQPYAGSPMPPVPPYAGAVPAVPPGYQPPATERVCSAGFSVLMNRLLSRGFLAVCICYTGALCINFVSTLFGANPGALLGELGAPGFADTVYRVVMVLLQSVGVLLCVALWRLRSNALGAVHGGALAPGGFGLWRVALHLSFGVSAVGEVLMLGLGVVLCAGGASDSFFAAMGIGIIFGALCGAVLTVLYWRKGLKTLTAVAHTAQTGYPSLYVSRLVSVMYVMSGVSSGFSAFSLLSTLAFGPDWESILLLLGSCLMAAYSLLMGIGLQGYRRQMQRVAADAYYGQLQ